MRLEGVSRDEQTKRKGKETQQGKKTVSGFREFTVGEG